MFYRGSMDLPVSFIVAFLTPWTLASLVHYVHTLLSLTCFFAFTVGIFVAYVNPLVFFMETVREASHFETNFRLSLKQMYAGDRLSKKETSILPKTSKPLEMLSEAEPSTYAGSTKATSHHRLSSTAGPDQMGNLPGSIKQIQYPTTQLLKRSSMRLAEATSDEASYLSSVSDLEG